MTRWIAVADKLPPLDKEVLVCRRGEQRSVCIMRLQEQNSWTTGSCAMVTGFCWHNGYRGFEFTDSYWADLPEPPPHTQADLARIAAWEKLQDEMFANLSKSGTWHERP